jgi:hypothetical protein
VRGLLAAALLAAAVPSISAQEIHWSNEFVFYLDNTEFFTPYRTGETILGSYFKTCLELGLGDHTRIRAGVFGDHRSGDTTFLDPVKPIIAFLWHTDNSQVVLGTLEPPDRHGYLEPLEVTTLTFTRPLEYGGQWIEDQKHFHIDAYLNWQHLNTPTSREIIDSGFVTWLNFLQIARLEGQFHIFHHGGQLHDIGPVTNNIVGGPGVRVEDDLGGKFGKSSLSVFYLMSRGPIDVLLGGKNINGDGVYVRASVELWRLIELALIVWRGQNFITQEGDHNYGSIGVKEGVYNARRRYEELAAIKRFKIAGTVDGDAEFRLNRIDGKLEYSYRLSVLAPFDLRLR